MDGFASFTAMLRAVLGDRLAPGAATFSDMFAPDAAFEFPFAPPGMARAARGRAEIDRHLASLTDFALDAVSRPAVHWVEGGDAVVLEFEARGRNTRTGAAYDQRYVSVIELRDGRIALYRDYWNPLAVLAAFGGEDDVVGRWERTT
ncbi:nuclear transport factor 2 family protein [Arenibaculum sp.]|jgi:hypothetical protein|uniref:nuclear transport factor 2 family protein n=1 Tax=Arenibaculum sp. TaxID=2865862 RepID=UPI002E15FCD4|nr:nuclear transport factor 2 family protein [Arenibaculum sp.]